MNVKLLKMIFHFQESVNKDEEPQEQNRPVDCTVLVSGPSGDGNRTDPCEGTDRKRRDERRDKELGEWEWLEK